MALTLPATGTLAYGDISFDGYVRTTATMTPVWDRARRVVKWVKFVFDIAGVVNDSTFGTDDEMDSRLAFLLRPGLEFRFQNKGLGADIHVNGSSNIRDSDWGPKPISMTWTPIGNDRTALVRWQVEVCIPTCANPVYEGISEFSYGGTVDVDRNGYSTRSISGILAIAQTRRNGRVPASADDFKDAIVFPVPDGFERIQNRWEVTPSKSELTFVIVDKEIRSPYPLGATTVEAGHRVSGSLQSGNFTKWDVTLSARIVLPPNRPKSDTWRVFKQIVISKIGELLKGDRDGAFAYQTGFEVDDDPYGIGTSYELKFWLMGVFLTTILVKSGLWRPLRNGFAEWRNSLVSSAYGPRGSAQLRLNGGEVLVGLCEEQDSRSNSLRPRRNFTGARLESTLTPSRVPIQSSWVYFDSSLRLIERNRVAVHDLLPTEDPIRFDVPGSPQTNTLSTVRNFQKVDGAKLESVPAPRPQNAAVIQSLGSPSIYLEFTGTAARLGYKVAIPRVISIGGIEVTQLSADVQDGILANAGGVPLHWARWTILYALPEKYTGPAPTLVNPQMGIDGSR